MELPDKLLIKCVKNSIWNIFFFLQIFTNSHVIAKWVSWAIQTEKQIVQRFWMTNSNCHNLTWITTILENVHLFKLVTLNNSIDSMEFYASALIFFQRHFKPDYALGYGFFLFWTTLFHFHESEIKLIQIEFRDYVRFLNEKKCTSIKIGSLFSVAFSCGWISQTKWNSVVVKLNFVVSGKMTVSTK